MNDNKKKRIMKLLPRFCIVKGISMNGRRLACDPSEIEHYYDAFEVVLQGFSVALVFKIDETGRQAWVDAHAKKVVIPGLHEEATIKIPVERGKECNTARRGHSERKASEAAYYQSGSLRSRDTGWPTRT
jgi:hypothetical protein